LREIAVDGTKVRACASKSSFKTGTRLAQIEAEVAARLAALKAELESDPAACSRRQRAARERAAREVAERARQAQAALERVRAERQERAKTHAKDEAKKSEPKASTGDAEARCMRFADGAIRPAFNAQIAAAPQEGIIVSVEMTDRRNDSGLAPPMVDDIVRRYGEAPQNLLVDTSYATVEDIAVLAAHAAGPVTVYTPPPQEREDVTPGALRNRKSQRSREPESVKQWRQRMGSDTGHKVYARRKLIERLNAQCKNQGFGILRVRGRVKAKAVALMHALANNLMAAHRLRAVTV
jgi:hypothetical protein